MAFIFFVSATELQINQSVKITIVNLNLQSLQLFTTNLIS